MLTRTLVPLALALAVAQVAHARQVEPLPLTRLQQPIVLDGRLDDVAWESVPALPLETWEPTAGLEPSQPTQI